MLVNSMPFVAHHQQRYSWAYMFGAICPARGTGVALTLAFANAERMTLHLAKISAIATPGACVVLTVDGAGWHQTGAKLSNRVSDRDDAIVDACCDVWLWLTA